MKRPTFQDYSCRELEKLGQAAVEIIGAHYDDAKVKTEEWTELVLDLFASFAKDGALIEARKPRENARSTRDWRKELPVRKTYKEFASFDMLHSNNPIPREEFIDEYYSKLISQEFEIFLALESERGKSGSRKTTRAEVLEDAIKLAIVRARCKVMIFGPVTDSHTDALFEDLEKLRESAKDPSPWLLVSVPWTNGNPQFSVLWCGTQAGECVSCRVEGGM